MERPSLKSEGCVLESNNNYENKECPPGCFAQASLPAKGWVEGLVKISGLIIKLARVRPTRLPDPSTCAECPGTSCRLRSSGRI